MKPAARVGDKHDCSTDIHQGGEIIEGSPNVTINGKPAARVDDNAPCENGGDNKIAIGSATVFINGKAAARVGDAMDHGGNITIGSDNVLIGSGGNKVIFGNKGKIVIGKNVHIGGNSVKSEASYKICEAAWDDVMAETMSIANIKDPIVRNKKITAAYAKTYLKKPEVQWLFIAAIASKEVGVKMQSFPIKQVFLNTLGQGNKDIFMDIYPILKFYSQYSLKELKECQGLIGDQDKKILDYLENIKNGQISDNRKILVHEQRDIAQPMYDDNLAFRLSIQVNHYLNVVNKLQVDVNEQRQKQVRDGGFAYVSPNPEIYYPTQDETLYFSAKQEGLGIEVKNRDLTNYEQRMSFADEVSATAVKLIRDNPDKAYEICDELIKKGN